MRAVLPLLLVVGCAGKLEDDQPCLEVGYAIASRTAECEDDGALGADRQEAFEAAYTCDLPERQQDVEASVDIGLYECALVVRNLACELVVAYGDDLELWLSSSQACAAILEPA